VTLFDLHHLVRTTAWLVQIYHYGRAADRHHSQMARLEQAMAALAEAQVKTEDDARQLRRVMTQLAKAQLKTEAALATLAEAHTQTERQFQAYLRSRPTN